MAYWVKYNKLKKAHAVWFHYVMFSKRHNYENGGQISACQGTGCDEGLDVTIKV